MECQKVRVSHPTSTCLCSIMLEIIIIEHIVAWILSRRIDQKAWNYIIPTLRNDHLHKSKYASKEIIIAEAVVVYQLILFYILENLKSDGCVEEENSANKLDNLTTFRQNVDNGVKMCLAPGVLQKNLIKSNLRDLHLSKRTAVSTPFIISMTSSLRLDASVAIQ